MINPLNTRLRGIMIFAGITTVLLMPSCDVGLARGETGGSHDEGAETVDVVIVGAGISGLTAALELGRGGANVMVVDMASVFGGHAVMSQGGLCIVDTPVQQKMGIQDSLDLAYQDFIQWGEDADSQWVRYYVDHSRRDIYDWLKELGVQFDEKVGSAPGNSVDRFHQPTGRGIGLVTPIYRECLTYDKIRFFWNCQAIELLTQDQIVKGVLTRNLRTGVERELRARAVILATGGFQNNLDMVRDYWPDNLRFPERILTGSGRNSVGFGHKMAAQAGAHFVKMDHQWNYFTGIPDPRYPDTSRGLNAANMYGIIVNAEGRRFANLHNWAKEVMPLLLRQEKATLWFVFDESSKREFVIAGTDWGDFKKVDKLILRNQELVKSAGSLERLARLAGLPPRQLAETIKRYNELVDRGSDVDFGRFGPERPEFSNKASPRIDQPPFYAMQTYPLTRKSMGGVAIDGSCRVLDRKGKVISGLYAVGELTGLAGINGKAALEGTFLGPCIITGQVAARMILSEPVSPVKTLNQTRDNCLSCHDVTSEIDDTRPGYWHYEQSHQIVLERGTDCRQCHAELSPYREETHQINRQVLATSCAACHIAKE